MTEFTLDTSGVIKQPIPGYPNGGSGMIWRDLDSFTQGYVEALFESAFYPRPGFMVMPADSPAADGVRARQVGFSDLAPEGLAAILKDCADFVALGHWVVFNKNTGADFWRDRNGRQLTIAGSRRFPPLAVILDNDGKIRLDPTP